MQMFIGDNPSPDVDGVFDTHVVIHEYGHGLSLRLVGVSSLQSFQQMGEDWSDWVGLALLAKPGDDPAAPHPVGTYLFGQSPNGPGIRPFPYSTNSSVNPQIFSDIDSVSVPHGVGSVWSQILWVVRGKLLEKHGFAANELMLQLVVDGLKLTPPNPGFIDGRDAILQADMVNNGGDNLCELWAGFAERGLGLSAFSSSNDTLTVTDGFDTPENVCVNSTGRVRFDEPKYPCTATISIEVADLDLAGDGTVTVAVTSDSGDAETLTLVEDGDSGVFTASIATSDTTASPGNNALESGDGDSIEVTYEDADTGEGSADTVTDSAETDCSPPIPTGVTVTAISGITATVEFDTSELATAVIRYGTSPGDLSSTATGTLATDHAVRLSGLTQLTDYFFSIEVTDEAGNQFLDTNGGSFYQFSTAEQADYFTEIYTLSDNPLDNKTFTFTPDSSSGRYSVCSTDATVFPSDPTGGTGLTLGDDDFLQITPAVPVVLYGTSYDSFFVGSNGYLTFESGDFVWTETLEQPFSLPRISPLFDDLTPPLGGSVSFREFADRIAISYENIREFSQSTTNTFQVELFHDGRIAFTYLGIAATDGLVGLSEGIGVPVDFQESDYTTYGDCCSGQPNLKPESLELAGGSEVEQEEDITSRLTATMANIGDTDSGAFSGAFYLSEDAIITTDDTPLAVNHSAAVPGIDAGETTVLSPLPAGMSVPVDFVAGPAYIGLILDDQEAIDECLETNNTIALMVEVTSNVVPPIAAFSASATFGCDTLTVDFTDSSTNTPVSWSWNFGDGNTSDLQNPSHTYTTPGTYTVSLTASNLVT
jgi:hypothetical protein